MTPEATPNDEFLSIMIGGEVDDIDVDDFMQREIRQDHQESLSQLRAAIATYAKKPDQKALNEIATALDLCSSTFLKKMRCVLADFDQPEDCIKTVVEEIAEDETWRSNVITTIVADSQVIPAEPEDISANLNSIIRENDIDTVDDVLTISSALYSKYMTLDLNKMSSVVTENYNKRRQRYLSIGRSVLDIAKIAAGAAVAIMLTKGIDRR